MKRALPLLAALAACQPAPETAAAATALPAEVAALLPADVAPSDVTQTNGCWSYAFEGLNIPVTRNGVPYCTN